MNIKPDVALICLSNSSHADLNMRRVRSWRPSPLSKYAAHTAILAFRPVYTFCTPFSNSHKPMLNSVIQINATKIPIHLNSRHIFTLYDAARFFVP